MKEYKNLKTKELTHQIIILSDKFTSTTDLTNYDLNTGRIDNYDWFDLDE